MTKISNVGALIGCPRCKQTLRELTSYAKRHVSTPYKVGRCFRLVRHYGWWTLGGTMLRHQMWYRCKRMCHEVIMSSPKAVIGVDIFSDIHTCQTCREFAGCHSALPDNY